ncbi:MAG: DNA-binding transcriptional regulator OxyR [Phyllobacteriaceae bacterium]|nr:DNA-binding transcriptional regulator OxyR [Phyllobacteriaceae bacterium]
MNLQQLEYILAVDQHRHFAEAAKNCHVTQPTLSTMIQKLEDELGVKIFDRSKKPVLPTEEGKKLIAQARKVLAESRRFQELASELKGELRGVLELGIIPTVAPYLLPAFLTSFLERFPDIHLHIIELTTEEIIRRLKHHQLDAAILATPLNDPSLYEHPLYDEEFVAYASPEQPLLKKQFVAPEDIKLDELWLLEEGHCLRTQVVNLCELRYSDAEENRLAYAAGSVETLKKMVDMGHGVTILPEMAIADLTDEEHARLRFFKPPAPVREISLVTYRYFARERLFNAIAEHIRASVPVTMQKRKAVKKVPVRGG